MGFAGYFLIVADFIQWARDHDIPVGPGRGSGAGSLVAYALGITDLDPIEYGLLFERFLNPERVSLPDFDIDFCMDRRDEVIDYVAKRYGQDKVSQIITYGTMAARAVVRDVGRVMGHPYGFVDTLAKLVPFELGITLDKALEQEPLLAQRYQDEEEVAELIDAARALEGLPRNVGKHAGGVVIAPKPLPEFTPLYSEPGMPQPITQFDKDDLESIGLIKFDFLGLRTLTVIDNAVKLVNQRRHASGDKAPALDIQRLALDDAKTYELIKSGTTTGIFQLESRGMREIIQRLLPSEFNDLVALVALFRPGPLQSGMVDDFINRKHGRETVSYPHPKLEQILRPTYGVILYQEQVMQISQVLAGFTLGAADLLRRAMGKKKQAEMDKQKEIFVKGAVAHGVKQQTATYIFDLMDKFAGYGFNKSHSAAYALLSYQTAWLKTHYPAEFIAAGLSADMEHTDKVVVLLREAHTLGLSVKHPNVNQCETQFTPLDATTILYGLGAIKGVGGIAMESLITERQAHGEFKDIYDLCARTDSRRINKRALEALIKSGAMDCFGEHRAQLLATLPSAMSLADQQQKDRHSGQRDLFGAATDAITATPPPTITTPQWSKAEILSAEKATLGFYLSGHPYDQMRCELKSLVKRDIQNLKPNGQQCFVAGLVSSIRTMKTKRGDTMAILSLDDNTATIEVSVFAELRETRRQLLQSDTIVVVRGRTKLDDYTGTAQLQADEIFDINAIRAQFLNLLEICVSADQKTSTKLQALHKLLNSNEALAATKVQVRYTDDHNSEVLLKLNERFSLAANDNSIMTLEDLFGHDNLRFLYRANDAKMA